MQSASYAQASDIQLLRKINVERNPKLDQTFLGITHSTSPLCIGTPAVLLTVGLIKKDRALTRNALMTTGALITSTIFTTSLKYGINRDRPFITHPEIEKLAPAGSPAFPSGHTSMAFSVATSVSISYPKWYVIVPSHLYACAVGYSRMHLGVHYPSDVFFGALIGSGSAWLSSILTKKIQEKRKQKHLLL